MSEVWCIKENEELNSYYFSDSSIWQQHLGHWYTLDTNKRTFNDSRVR